MREPAADARRPLCRFDERARGREGFDLLDAHPVDRRDDSTLASGGACLPRLGRGPGTFGCSRGRFGAAAGGPACERAEGDAGASGCFARADISVLTECELARGGRVAAAAPPGPSAGRGDSDDRDQRLEPVVRVECAMGAPWESTLALPVGHEGTGGGFSLPGGFPREHPGPSGPAGERPFGHAGSCGGLDEPDLGVCVKRARPT